MQYRGHRDHRRMHAREAYSEVILSRRYATVTTCHWESRTPVQCRVKMKRVKERRRCARIECDAQFWVSLEGLKAWN